MSKVIIGIHGLGNKPNKVTLEKWWLEAICEGLIRVNRFNYKPHFKIVYWADILHDKPLSELIEDNENPYYLDEPYTPSIENTTPVNNTKRKKFLEFLEDQMDRIFLNEDLSANFNFISDIIFKKYFMELDVYYSKQPKVNDTSFNTVKDIIRNRLAQELNKHKGKEILLIAHSMGSIVAYDVCNFVTPNVKINTFVTMGSPLGLPIIMGKIADEQKVNDPDIKELRTPENIIGHWFNYADIEDNVALNYNLEDDFESNSKGIKVKDKVIVNDYIINGERNPHKSYGYLRAPEFSNMLANFLERDTNALTLWWQKQSYNCKTMYQELKDKLVLNR